MNYSRFTLFLLVALTGLNSWADEALIVKSKGRSATGRLKLKSSKVPTYEIFKDKNIPRLDIGEEAVVEAAANKAPADVKSLVLNLKPLERLSSPKVPEIDSKKIGPLPLTAPKSITNDKNIAKIPVLKDLKAVNEPNVEAADAKTKTLIPMKDADYKLLEALIYLDLHKNFEQALALLGELLKGNDYKYEALYAYSLTAQALKLNSEFRFNMFRVAKESKDKNLQVDAVQSLVDFVESLEISDLKELEPLVAKFDIDTTNNDAYSFYRAKFFLEEGNLGQVEDALLFVPEKSKFYGDALLVSALYNYRRGKVDESIHDLDKLSRSIEKYSRLQGIAAITLARAYFQKGMYKEASSSYLTVNKADPLWLQAMVEQAWTQILQGDYVGAAGNMFTLHTDFFKNAFAPESYVVRTVGYLNLCQFGDGLQVLSNLHKKYDPAKEKLESYKSSHKEANGYYETVKAWFKNTDLKEVDGLPRTFIVELARHPSFMKIQTQINNFEDEIEGFNKATLAIIQREKTLIKKQSEAKEELAKIHKLASAGKANLVQVNLDSAYQEKRLAAYKIQYQLTNRARTLIKELREKALIRVEKEKVVLRAQAGQALKLRFEGLVADLKRVLDQNDVLQYELYSGAGEHIRYQMAGGDTKDKDSGDKKTDDKKVSWKFKGEIWEDEVGHFRSSLENVCPKEDAAVAAK